MNPLAYPLPLSPVYRDYLWGGQRLRPGRLTAEAWVVYEGDRIASGPLAGRVLAEVAAEYGVPLLGERVVQRTGNRFPLLVKILDCAQWLSLQVHPDDAQAVRLEGPGHFGKTEAWHVLAAQPDARLIVGLRPGVAAEALAQAIRRGSLLDYVQYRDVQAGNTVFMPAGVVHALGPGLLIYEVQQSSDLTYRVYDWGRPQTGGRGLHIEKSLATIDPAAVAPFYPAPALGDDGRAILVRCPYFTLELLAAQARPVELETAGQTFHALTVIDGRAEVATAREGIVLGRFDSAIIPAVCGRYHLRPLGAVRVLKAASEEIGA